MNQNDSIYPLFEFEYSSKDSYETKYQYRIMEVDEFKKYLIGEAKWAINEKLFSPGKENTLDNKNQFSSEEKQLFD